jgi:hypothetical protein
MLTRASKPIQAADRIFETKGLDMGDSAKEKQVRLHPESRAPVWAGPNTRSSVSHRRSRACPRCSPGGMISVNRNWRLTFAFENGDAILVDYQDYH